MKQRPKKTKTAAEVREGKASVAKPSRFGPHRNYGFCAEFRSVGNLLPAQTFAYTRTEADQRLGSRPRTLFRIVRAIVVDPRFFRIVPPLPAQAEEIPMSKTDKQARDVLRGLLAKATKPYHGLTRTDNRHLETRRRIVVWTEAEQGLDFAAFTHEQTREADAGLFLAAHNSLPALLDYLEACEEEADAALAHEAACWPIEPKANQIDTMHALADARKKRDALRGEP